MCDLTSTSSRAKGGERSRGEAQGVVITCHKTLVTGIGKDVFILLQKKLLCLKINYVCINALSRLHRGKGESIALMGFILIVDF